MYFGRMLSWDSYAVKQKAVITYTLLMLCLKVSYYTQVIIEMFLGLLWLKMRSFIGYKDWN